MTEPSSPSYSFTSPAGFKKWRERHTFEYHFKKYFSLTLPDEPMNEILAEEGMDFRMNEILNFTSNWVIETVEDGEIIIKRTLYFHPPPDIKQWRIRLRICDWITTDAEISDANAKTFEVVASEENKKCTFEYSLKESDIGTFNSNTESIAACMDITVLENQGLDSLIGKSVDFTKEFEESNVILEVGGIKFHFLFELLALQSQFFYDQWLELKNKKDGNPTIKLEGMDPSDVLLVLKMLYYRRSFATTRNLQIILGIADKLKFEMILKHCEEFLMSFTDEHIDTATRLQLAYRYDLNGQLSSFFSNDKSRNVPPPAPLHDINAKKFEFPEMMTKSSKSGVATVKPRDSRYYYSKKMSSVINWAFGFYNSSSRGFLFGLRPYFSDHSNASMRVSNWMVVADFKLKREGQDDIVFRETFTTAKPSVNRMLSRNVSFPGDEPIHVPFKLNIDVKCIKGLRYYVKKSLRDFSVKHPSSDILLVVNGHKFFANLNILAHNSLFFAGKKRHIDTMSSVDEEHGIPKVEFDDISTSGMHKLLVNMYYWTSEFSDDSTVEKILPLVQRFLCIEMKMAIQDYLVSTRFPMGVRTLQLAFDYDLFYVKEEYLMSFQYASEIHGLSADPDFKYLSNEAKVALFDRLSELPLIEETTHETNRSPLSYSPRSPSYSP